MLLLKWRKLGRAAKADNGHGLERRLVNIQD